MREHALLRQLNRLLTERRADVYLARSATPAERRELGDYYLVANPNRYIIVRDRVDLYEFARECCLTVADGLVALPPVG